MEGNMLRAPKGAVKRKKIRARGSGTGRGGKSGRGDKGQKSRAGGGVRPGFEGGQMPLYRRIARRGFSNHPFKEAFQVVNLVDIDKKYSNGETVSVETLREKGLIKSMNKPVKILGVGALTKKLVFDVVAFSKTAEEGIKKSGGTIGPLLGTNEPLLGTKKPSMKA